MRVFLEISVRLKLTVPLVAGAIGLADKLATGYGRLTAPCRSENPRPPSLSKLCPNPMRLSLPKSRLPSHGCARYHRGLIRAGRRGCAGCSDRPFNKIRCASRCQSRDFHPHGCARYHRGLIRAGRRGCASRRGCAGCSDRPFNRIRCASRCQSRGSHLPGCARHHRGLMRAGRRGCADRGYHSCSTGSTSRFQDVAAQLGKDSESQHRDSTAKSSAAADHRRNTGASVDIRKEG